MGEGKEKMQYNLFLYIDEPQTLLIETLTILF